MSKSSAKKQKIKEVDWTSLDKAQSMNDFIESVVDKPERFVDADAQLVESISQNLKLLYDLSKETEKEQMGPLKQLLIKGFDETQIWEEIQSQNRPLLKHLSEHINDICQQFQLEQSQFDLLTSAQLVARKQEELKKLNKLIEQKAKMKLQQQLQEVDLEDDEDDLENGENEEENGEDDDVDIDHEENGNGEADEDELEDKFFKLDDMEKFVQQAEDEDMLADEDDDKDINDLLLGEDDEEGLEDNLDEQKEENEEDEEQEDEESALVGEDDEELDEEDLELERALEKRARGLKQFLDDDEEQDDAEEDGLKMRDLDDLEDDGEAEGMDEDEDEDDKEAADEKFWNVGKKKSKESEDDKQKSEFAQKQAKLKAKIKDIEKDLVAEKPWTLIGEASAADRPQNSLLEATLDFEYATKLAPVVTEEYTNEIEELIRKRIAEQLFDDVLRKLPQETKQFKPSVELDMEKSKLGLAEVYEQEYMEKVMGAQKADKLSEQHEEIDMLFNKVCKKLDALANFHYTPNRAEAKIKTKTNVPSIRMEEAVPIAVSESTTLAPREIYEPENASLKNTNELTQEDRKKQRKQKKAIKKKQNAEKEAADKLKKKLNPAETQANGKKAREEALKLIKEQRNTTIASKDSTGTGSSTTLFKKLQEEADKKVASIRGEKPTQQKKETKSATAFKM